MEEFGEFYIHDGIEYDVWYKIVDEIKGQIKTLFHGYGGERKIPTAKWIFADVKIVSDGKGTQYISGFHIITTHEECVDYLKRFKNIEPKRIVKCIAKSIRPKSHSRHSVYLAEMMYLLPEDAELEKRRIFGTI